MHFDVDQGAAKVTNGGGRKILFAGQFGFVQNKTVPLKLVPSGPGATSKTPGLAGGPASGKNAARRVQ